MQPRVTVLIVDDEPDVMSVATDIFDLLGYDVVAADSPAQALEILRAMPGSVALLFTDVRMPETDGVTLAQLARALAPELVVVYTSGFPQTLGENVFVPKPYTLHAVADAVGQALARTPRVDHAFS